MVLKPPGGVLERFPIAWNHVIVKVSRKFKEWDHVKIEVGEPLF
jgi:hypothetical protein